MRNKFLNLCRGHPHLILAQNEFYCGRIYGITETRFGGLILSPSIPNISY